MTTGIHVRQSPSGRVLRGTVNGSPLVWDAATQLWVPRPQSYALIVVNPVWTGGNGNQVAQWDQGAKGISSQVPMVVPQNLRGSIMYGGGFTLAASDTGPLTWVGAQSSAETHFSVSMQVSFINTTTPNDEFWFGFRRGGELITLGDVKDFKASAPTRQTAHCTGVLGLLPGLTVWPAIGSTAALLANDCQYTEFRLLFQELPVAEV
jgi:hypothetical protein